MTALVRWSRERVCLEAIELGCGGTEDPMDPSHRTAELMLVARFVGADAGASIVSLTRHKQYHEPVTCRLTAGGAT